MTRASACRDIVCLQNTGNELLRIDITWDGFHLYIQSVLVCSH